MHWMEEAAAKEKWCPMTHSRDVMRIDIGENQTGVIQKNNCIGERCACWQLQFTDKRELGRCGLTHAL